MKSDELNVHFDAIDGLRSVASIGIIMMHVNANTDYIISGWLYNQLIPSFTDFTYLFMVISAFGMCCGYFDKIIGNSISMIHFYKSRYRKMTPFFSCMVLIDVLLNPSISSAWEAFSNITLLFGFLPNSMSVVGVGWFLGLVFIFYLIFPFFCTLLSRKTTAWAAFFLSIIYHLACTQYFDVGRRNILYSGCFFMAGGLIYLYRDFLSTVCHRTVFLAVLGLTVTYFVTNRATIVCLALSSFLLIYTITYKDGILTGAVAHFFSGISMEIYLCHMVVFRALEKLGIPYLLGIGWIAYAGTTLLVISGSSFLAVCFQFASRRVRRRCDL